MSNRRLTAQQYEQFYHRLQNGKSLPTDPKKEDHITVTDHFAPLGDIKNLPQQTTTFARGIFLKEKSIEVFDKQTVNSAIFQDCKNLRELSKGFICMGTLRIEDCQNLELLDGECYQNINLLNCPKLELGPKFTSKGNLRIIGECGITEIDTSLKELYLTKSLKNLKKFGPNCHIGNIHGIEHLKLEEVEEGFRCPNIKEINQESAKMLLKHFQKMDKDAQTQILEKVNPVHIVRGLPEDTVKTIAAEHHHPVLVQAIELLKKSKDAKHAMNMAINDIRKNITPIT